MATALAIGDAIIDAVEVQPGKVEHIIGGAGLNLAVGMARLGLDAQFLTRFGQDRDGFRILRHLREEGVKVFNTPNVDPTGVVFSTRAEGQPTYHFAPVMFRRRIGFSGDAAAAIAGADVVAVNSFPFDDEGQAAHLVGALRGARGFVVVDPNPRPNVIPDMDRYRRGAEMAFAEADIVKISDEDAELLYGAAGDAPLRRLFGLGVKTIFFTHGGDGASIHTAGGMRIDVPAAAGDGPIIDTMGAGDAALATLIYGIVRHGLPGAEDGWRGLLEDSMRVARATCGVVGAGLVLPAPAGAAAGGRS